MEHEQPAEVTLLTWKGFDEAIGTLADKVVHKGGKNIYGIPRGGLMVAVALSHRLGLPLILDERDVTESTIVADDIVDSGKTLYELMQKRKYKVAVALYVREDTPKNWSLLRCHTAYLKHKAWVIFPWETAKSTKTSSRKE